MPYAIHLAHFHQYTDVNDCDIYTTVNGSLCGTDDYALTLRKITKPAQNFIIYGDDRCIYSLQIGGGKAHFLGVGWIAI